MEELLRIAFTLGQQWVQDMNNDKEPVNFNDWYNSNETQQQLKILNIPIVTVPLPDSTKEMLAEIIRWEKDLSEYESLEAVLNRKYIISKRQ